MKYQKKDKGFTPGRGAGTGAGVAASLKVPSLLIAERKKPNRQIGWQMFSMSVV